MSKEGEPEVKKPFVYIVDDQESVLRALAVALGRRYRIEYHTNGRVAVGEIIAKRPDVVILDIKMPDADGFWVLRELRRQKQTVPVILNSAYQDTVLPDDLQGIYRPFGIVEKSGNLTSLKALITKAIEKKA